MEFYWIKNSDDKSLSGKQFSQIEFISPDYGNPNSYGNLTDQNPIEKIDTVFKLLDSAVLTDNLRYNVDFFIINSKAKSIFEQHSISDAYFIPVKVMEPSNNSWFVLYTPRTKKSLESIDYVRTVFHITDPFEEETFSAFQIAPGSEDKVSEWQSHAKKTEFEQYVQFKELYLKEECLTTKDLFYLSPFHLPKNLISKRLKDALESADITGFKFLPANVCNK